VISTEDVFVYELPSEKIAQRPIRPYDKARLLIVDRKTSEIKEACFCDLPEILSSNDALLFNNTKVLPSRLFGKLKGSGAEIEILLVARAKGSTWRCMARPLKKLKNGSIICFENGLEAEVIERRGEKEVEINFPSASDSTLQNTAVMPIPPYIRDGHADEEDLLDYQSQFAEISGSIAAPTASLHFTPELINSLKKVNVPLQFVTLHLGTASFRALWDEGASELSPPAEEYLAFDNDLLLNLSAQKKSGKRLVAVGTSVVRAIESMAIMQQPNDISELQATELFITPGFKFNFVDALITNFHQPKSTHLLLVEAFLGRELLEKSYQYALDNNFRFLSYGDGMLIL